MKPSKDDVAASIAAAQENLEKALGDLESMPVLPPDAIAYAAHALDNYLTVSAGTIELLTRVLKDHPDPDVMRWLGGLQRVTTTMDHTVNQLMGTAAEAAPRLSQERVDLPTLVRRCCEFYERVAARKQIRIVTDIAREVPNTRGDRVAIAAVMDNLLSNAVKFSPVGTAVTVRIEFEPVSVVCSVCDTGPGIRDEDRPRLFKRGEKLSSRPTAGEPSNGFGLAVAKDLIDRMGGTLVCDSNTGGGACFRFRLPVYR